MIQLIEYNLETISSLLSSIDYDKYTSVYNPFILIKTITDIIINADRQAGFEDFFVPLTRTFLDMLPNALTNGVFTMPPINRLIDMFAPEVDQDDKSNMSETL